MYNQQKCVIMIDVNSVKNDGLAFKSRIVFLSPKGLRKVAEQYRNKDLAYIVHYNILPDAPVLSNCYRQNVKVGITNGVKTCSSGICVEKGQEAPLFWHVEDNSFNMENLPLLTNLIQGTNAIIIGAKENYKLSCEMFDKFVEQLHLKNIPTTIIKGTKTSEADLLYEAKKDTLYVCMRDIYQKDHYVKSKLDLDKTCDVVKISPTDSVEFYDELPKISVIKKIQNFFSKII